MPSLQVRELPEPIYRRLQEEARKERRNFAQQAIVTLAKGLGLNDNPKQRRAAVLKDIKENPVVLSVPDLIDPVSLVREDRDR
ncbi:hypothetical protein DSCO28_70780 [Desulfosarcina ovata subsp. sediminis]|uniref:Uncharacterized protein n=1 Tax=Desulfosarcina ovata subsp. sediminis TaxID=885957 RepID=A0A5K8A1T8_9BACT|nr:hypothetical protein [Desulfosarcina ovata]BBO86512.1 hypothetical protein DSCO28_70780 [Desulfosarcina ovata subsp. sediminis]